MNVLITGASGLVGRELVKELLQKQCQVSRLVRSKESLGADEIYWDPMQGEIDRKQLEGFDAIVHLAGENIASSKWTEEKKTRIRDSRAKGTRLLSETLATLSHPPRVLVSASAIGCYGDRGDEVLSEKSALGTGFLPDISRGWEGSTEPASAKGIRVVHLRIGIVMSDQGGALARMLPPFRLGLGGRMGTGKQYMSWIAIDDLVGAIWHSIISDSLKGPVNAVAPYPVTNSEFTRVLGKVLSRPTFLPIPLWGLRLVFGEFVNDILLSSTRVLPKQLQSTGYVFRHSTLQDALTHVLSSS